MEANELMIGDLLRVTKDVCIKKGTIVRVRAIDANDSLPQKGLKCAVRCQPIDDIYGMNIGGVWLNFLEPIPLTAEILEKNGWKYNEMPFIQGWEQFGLLLYAGGEGYRINCGNNVAMRIDAVHELQHALKLCGIDKTIEI